MEELQSVLARGNLLVVVVVVLVTGLGSVLADLTVSPHSQYCTQHPTFLSCDFKGAEEVVVLESLHKRVGQTVTSVYIHNAQQVVVADVCISFVGFTVANLTFTNVPEACSPGQHFSFRLTDSSTNLVPPYITQLELTRSTARDVTLTQELKAFSVVNSDIGHLEVTQPIKRVTMKVEHSVIDNLEKLHLDSKSYLVFYNVTINEMKRKSLHLRESTVTVWASSITTSLEQAIVLGHRSSMTLTDMDGKVSLAGPEEVPAMPAEAAPQTQEVRRPPGVPPKTPQVKASSCKKPSVLLWAIPTALAGVEAIIIIVNCTNWFPALRGRRVPHGVEEGQDVGRRRQLESQATSYPSSYNTWHYNSEVPMMPTSRRHSAGIDKYK